MSSAKWRIFETQHSEIDTQMKIIFKPTCTKCRILKKELESHDVAWENINYAEDGLEREVVEFVFNHYAGNWHDLVRTKEKVFKSLNVKLKAMSKEEAVDLIVAHPILIQRPIVLKDGKVIIARDDDALASIF